MIEKVSIEKDYLSGTEKHTKKIKPENTVCGDVTVSLYDENGEKVKDIFTQNIVMDWLKYEAYTNLYERKYAVGRGGLHNTESGFYTAENDYSHTDFPYTKYLVLLNGNHEDNNPKKCLTTDELVGYGIRRSTYSGESLTRGSYNPKESYTYVTEDGKLAYHMVFDFPTHSANGVITGIGFAHSLERGANIQPHYYSALYQYDSGYTGVPFHYCCSHWRNKDQTSILGPIKTNNGGYTPSDNNPIYIGYTSSWHSQSTEKKVCDKQYANITRGCMSSGTAGAVPFLYYNEKNGVLKMPYTEVSSQERVVCQNNSSKEISSNGRGVGFKYEEYNAQCIQTKEIIGTYDFDFFTLFEEHGLRPQSTSTSIYTSSIYIRTAGLIGDNLCIIARTNPSQYHFTDSSSSKTFMLIFDLNGSLLKRFDITNTAQGSSYSFKCIPYGKNQTIIQNVHSSSYYGNMYIINNNLTGDLNTITFDELNYGEVAKKGVFDTHSKTRNSLIGNHNEQIVYLPPPQDIRYSSDKKATTNGGSPFKYPSGYLQLSSYTRLPNAVTKTNTNTMKVQYDIVTDTVSKSDYIEL